MSTSVNNKEMIVTSISDSSAIMSAQAFLMGFYPPPDSSQELSQEIASKASPPFYVTAPSFSSATEYAYT